MTDNMRNRQSAEKDKSEKYDIMYRSIFQHSKKALKSLRRHSRRAARRNGVYGKGIATPRRL